MSALKIRAFATSLWLGTIFSPAPTALIPLPVKFFVTKKISNSIISRNLTQLQTLKYACLGQLSCSFKKLVHRAFIRLFCVLRKIILMFLIRYVAYNVSLKKKNFVVPLLVCIAIQD